MVIVGLTGSIGMGKTTVARYFRLQGVPVHDADQTVHDALSIGGQAVEPVKAMFANVAGPDGIDRKRLAQVVFDDKAALKRLEGILHPIVFRAQRRFLAHYARMRTRHAVLDVPLLFEIAGDLMCDVVAVASAPVWLQRKRVLSRPGMTIERLNHILAAQWQDAKKRRYADFVIPTGLNHGTTFRHVRAVIRDLDDVEPRRWNPGIYKV